MKKILRFPPSTFYLLSSIFPLSLFTAIVLAILWPGLFPPPGKMLFGDDIDRLSYFWISFFNGEVAKGNIPFWNPYQFSGLPYAQAFHSGIWYLPHWLLTVIPLQYAFAWYFAIHMVLSMVNMFTLLRRWTGKIPATMSAVAYGLSGPFSAQVWAGHFDAVAAMAYIPLVFHVFFYAMEKGTAKRTVLLAAAIALQFIAGYPVLTLFTMQMLGASAVFFVILKKSPRPLITTVIAAVLALGFLSVQYFPNAEYVSRTVRTFDISYGWLSTGALEVGHLVELVNPFVYGDQNTYFGPWQFYHERIGYIGLLPLVLGLAMLLIAVMKLQKAAFAWIFIGTALFGLWVSFAFNAPFDINRLLYEHVPMYQSIRIPTRHLVLFVFGMSVLSGLALSYLRHRLVQTAVLIIVIIDMVLFSRHFVSLKEMPTARHDPEVLKTIQSEKELVRYTPNFNIGAPPRDTIDFAAAGHYRIFSTTGYDPSMLRNYFEFISAMNGMSEPSIKDYDVQVPYHNLTSSYMNFLSVKYILVPPWQDGIGGAMPDRFRLIKEDGSRMYRFYENKRALPRFFFVREAVALENRQAIYQAIAAGEVANVANTVLVDKRFVPKGVPLQSDCPLQGYPAIAVVSYETNRIRLSSTGECGAVLASSEVVYPGWIAKVNGKETPILEANLAFRTIYVPPGTREIEFVYVPTTMQQGAIVTALSIGAALFWITLERIWQKKH